MKKQCGYLTIFLALTLLTLLFPGGASALDQSAFERQLYALRSYRQELSGITDLSRSTKAHWDFFKLCLQQRSTTLQETEACALNAEKVLKGLSRFKFH